MMPRRRHRYAVLRALQHLTANYGRGDVHSFDFLGRSDRGMFTYKIRISHYGWSNPIPKVFRHRILPDRVTVYAWGHQKTIKS